MAAKTRVPRDPFDWHIYIGYAVEDTALVGRLARQLESLAFQCCERKASDESIYDAVEFSEKCLLCVSSNYVNDCLSRVEMEAVREKADRFGDDFVILLKDPSLGELPQPLRGLHPMSWSTRDDVECGLPAGLVDEVLRRPELKPLPAFAHKISGYYEAFVYYYDYLRFVVPPFADGLKVVLEKLRSEKKTAKMAYVSELVIVVPDSCFAPISISDDVNVFQQEFVACSGDRGGTKGRDYKTSVFRVVDPAGGNGEDDVCFGGEFPACLLTLYEIQQDGRVGLTTDDLYRERDVFCQTLISLLEHPRNTVCHNRCRVLRWHDDVPDERRRVGLHKFLRDSFATTTSELETTARKEVASDVASPLPEHSDDDEQGPSTFDRVPVPGTSPASIYDTLDRYPMNRRPRGLAVIVNISEYEDEEKFPARVTTDLDQLASVLSTKLLFEVETKSDHQSSTELHELMNRLAADDHSRYDAFVCCIVSYGRRGVVYASDGLGVEVLDLAEVFYDRNCPSLSGKPRLFFVGTERCSCIDDDDENVQRENVVDINVAEETAVKQLLSSFESVDINGGRAAAALTARDAIMSSNCVEYGEQLVPSCSDFIMSYASLPTGRGSLYIQALRDNLDLLGDSMDSVLNKVDKQIRDGLARDSYSAEGNSVGVASHLMSSHEKRLVFPPP